MLTLRRRPVKSELQQTAFLLDVAEQDVVGVIAPGTGGCGVTLNVPGSHRYAAKTKNRLWEGKHAGKAELFRSS
jgi:hypothetical protein